ncbi:MAG: hypothetical protein AB1609_21055 [Bacillota bacterium]
MADRILVVGEAAPKVKATPGGGVYYGLPEANIAMEVLTRAMAEDDLCAASLADYDRRWRLQLGARSRWVFGPDRLPRG